MCEKYLFRESQAFRQVWIWAFLILMNGFLLYTVVMQWGLGQPVGNNPAGDVMLGVIVLFSLVLTLLFLVFRLQTEIRHDGIYTRFFPFQQRFRRIGWNELNRCYIRSYKPLAEYGGWGWRIGMAGAGQAYNVAGNKGLQLEFKNLKRLLIGTSRPGEMHAVLNSMNLECYSTTES